MMRDRPITAPEEDESEGWVRLAPCLVGEAVRLEGRNGQAGREGVVVGVGREGLLMQGPGLAEPGPALFAFDDIAAVAPLDGEEASRMRDRLADLASIERLGAMARPGEPTAISRQRPEEPV